MTQGARWDRGGTPRRARRWVVVLLLAVAAGAGALLGRGPVADDGAALRVEDARAPQRPVDPQVAPAGSTRDLEPGALVPGRWRAIGSGPLIGRSQATMTWTGSAAVVWGGLADTPRADGAAYDPASGTWTLLPDSPLSARFAHAAVWTGNEVVIAGGASTAVPGGLAVADLTDVAAFSSATGRWRSLPALPFPIAGGRLFAAHGRLFALAGDDRPGVIAMLEAGAPRWQELPVALPPQAGAVDAGMVGDELVVWSRRGVGAGVAADVSGDVTDATRWRPLRRSPQPLVDITACCALVASSAGGGVGGVDVIAYDLRRDVWRPLGEGADAELAVSPRLIFMVRLYGSSGALDRTTGTPLRLPPAPVDPRVGATAAWAGDRLLVWGGVDTSTGIPVADGAAFVMPAG